MSDVELDQRAIMSERKRGGETEIGVIGYFPYFGGVFRFQIRERGYDYRLHRARSSVG